MIFWANFLKLFLQYLKSLGFKDEFQSSCIRGLACAPHGCSERCFGFLWSSWVKRIRLVELLGHFMRLLDYYLWVWRQRHLATPPSVIGSCWKHGRHACNDQGCYGLVQRNRSKRLSDTYYNTRISFYSNSHAQLSPEKIISAIHDARVARSASFQR